MAEYGKSYAANYWLLGRRNLVGIEISACSEGNTVIGLEGGGTIFTTNKINELAVEMGWMPLSPDGIAMCHTCGVENSSEREGIHEGS